MWVSYCINNLHEHGLYENLWHIYSSSVLRCEDALFVALSGLACMLRSIPCVDESKIADIICLSIDVSAVSCQGKRSCISM